jgi:hypothetical protein
MVDRILFEFIYLEEEGHFGGWKMSHRVGPEEINNGEFTLALTNVRSLAEDG